MSTLCNFLFFLALISYTRAQAQNSAGRIVAGCTFGGLFVLCFLLLFVSFARSRRRARTAVNRRAGQYESKPLFGANLGRPVQQGPAPSSPYRPQGLAQAVYGNPSSVQQDPLLYNDEYYLQNVPPPAYDPNTKSVYFSQSSGYGTDGQRASDIPYNPPPFPAAAHLDGQ